MAMLRGQALDLDRFLALHPDSESLRSCRSIPAIGLRELFETEARERDSRRSVAETFTPLHLLALHLHADWRAEWESTRLRAPEPWSRLLDFDAAAIRTLCSGLGRELCAGLLASSDSKAREALLTRLPASIAAHLVDDADTRESNPRCPRLEHWKDTLAAVLAQRSPASLDHYLGRSVLRLASSGLPPAWLKHARRIAASNVFELMARSTIATRDRDEVIHARELLHRCVTRIFDADDPEK